MAALESKDSWLSPVLSFGLIKAKLCCDLLGVLWNNRKEFPYAWNLLNHGVCDGCSLGPYGLRDNVIDGVHLCMSRLKLLKLNTMAALDPSALTDVTRLRGLRPEKLRALGRLSHPMVRRGGEQGFQCASWDQALELVGKAIHDTAPHEMGFVAASHSLTNETYYTFQKLARVLGTNNVDLCSCPGHAAAASGLKATLGVGAPTCSLSDFIGTDLLVVFGADLADNQPVTGKYLRYARQVGTRVVVVDGAPETGLREDGVPATVSRALFRAKLIDDFFRVGKGGEIAFINGVLKVLIANELLDRGYVDQHTAGFAGLKAALDRQSWELLEQRSGLARSEMQRFALLYGQARSAVIVFTMGLTQQECGANNVKAVVNLALARGMLGRERCGVMPIRGQSGAQGAGECGVAADKFPGGYSINDDTARRFSNLWHHPVPSQPGLNAREMIETAHRGEMKFLYAVGGNLFDTMTDGHFVADALGRVSIRAHQVLALNPSMLVEGEQTVVLLPGQTRYEQKSGGTSTSTERRIRFTPEIPGHTPGEALPDWEIPSLIGRKTMPNGDKLFPFNDTQSIREEMSRVMPIYQGIEKLTQEGDHLQWGGPELHRDGFTAMPNNRALFTPLDPPDPKPAERESERGNQRDEAIGTTASTHSKGSVNQP